MHRAIDLLVMDEHRRFRQSVRCSLPAEQDVEEPTERSSARLRDRRKDEAEE